MFINLSLIQIFISRGCGYGSHVFYHMDVMVNRFATNSSLCNSESLRDPFARTLRATMIGSTEVRTVVSFWFDFDWTLSTGEPAPFTVVDVAELDEHGLIERLHIVYDTHPIRDAFNDAHDGEH